MRTITAAAVAVAAATLLAEVSAAPWSVGGTAAAAKQAVFGAGSADQAFSWYAAAPVQRPSDTSDDPDHPDWDPLEHSSGISPYHDAPGADISPPKGCSVTAAAFLIRHSCIHANDDEWEEFMAPFAERVYAVKDAFPSDGPLDFLNTWKSPITAENAESLTKPGKRDAFLLGKRFRELYPHLLPPKHLGRKPKVALSRDEAGVGGKDADASKVRTPFKVWTASSDRDIGTAKSFIRGAFPKAQEGHGGEGDGKYLSLVEVPNKDPNWGASLTPHKVCARFTKEEGRADAR